MHSADLQLTICCTFDIRRKTKYLRFLKSVNELEIVFAGPPQ